VAAAAKTTKRKPCIFCDNPRTNKRGEHVWDDWFNRIAGVPIRMEATLFECGEDGVLIRQRPAHKLDAAKPVVCDTCNNEWMSDLTGGAKHELEDSIRANKSVDLDAEAIVVVSAWAFLKTAVLDWGEEDKRPPRISRACCTTFRDSLVTSHSGDIAIPKGFQLWLAQYRSDRAFEAVVQVDELRVIGPYRGYAILVVTYIIGNLIFQATFPRWIGLVGTRRPPLPAFYRINDQHSVPIWPFVDAAYWPPLGQVTSSTFKDFRERFRRVLMSPSTSQRL
jgi:hypothetical protein